MTQSVFHVKHTDSCLSSEIHNCYEAISAFNLYSQQFDGAGTYFMQSIAQAMQGTPYQHVAEDCVKNLNDIFMARQTLKGMEQSKTLESALFTLKGHLDAGNRKDLSKVYAQTVFHILLQFVQMQSTYYNFCQEKIIGLVSKLNPNRDSESPEKCTMGGSATPTDSPTKHKPSTVEHNIPKISKPPSPKHQTSGNLKSSFFSFFERKSVPRDKQSAFYVDVTEDKNENEGNCPPPEGGLINPPPTIINEDTSAQTTSPRSHSSSNPNDDVSIDLASEEEIDSVINLLSGVGLQSSTNTMHSIPENQIQLTVPQLYRMPSPASDTHIDELKPPNFQMHRRSEGSLDLPSMHKNIWHSPHRGSLPGSHSPSPRPPGDNNNTNMGNNFSRRYSHDLYTAFRMGSPYVPSTNQLWPGSQWLTPSMNNAWLYNNTTNTHGSDTMNSSWSGVQDSSDLSDDDSCGEQFFAVGQDLVHALDSKEYSSEDENKDKGDKSSITAKTNTWPLLQNWENTGAPPTEPRGEYVQLAEDGQMPHRPVQMQWSDPMSTHSMWPSNPPGVPQQRHSQSMQGFSLYQ